MRAAMVDVSSMSILKFDSNSSVSERTLHSTRSPAHGPAVAAWVG